MGAASSGFTPASYTIYGSTDGGTTWTALSSVDAGQTSDDLDGLLPATTYLLRVVSLNDFGESAPSDSTSVSIGTGIPVSPPHRRRRSAGRCAGGLDASDSLATNFNIYGSTDGGTTWTSIDTAESSQTNDDLSG